VAQLCWQQAESGFCRQQAAAAKRMAGGCQLMMCLGCDHRGAVFCKYSRLARLLCHVLHLQVSIYKILMDTASGLDYLHSIGVVHGDLKTANVLLKGGKDQKGISCKITDFGLSRVLDMNASHISTGTHGMQPFLIGFEHQSALLNLRVCLGCGVLQSRAMTAWHAACAHACVARDCMRCHWPIRIMWC
jgi:hypothetical protein